MARTPSGDSGGGKCRIIARDIVVDTGKCTRCGECIELCPFGALGLGEDGYPEPLVDKCTVCLACMAVCDPRAITIIPGWECPE